MILLPLCLLAATGWLTQADADSAPSSYALNLTEPMLECLKQKKVYWPKQGKCHELPDSACGETSQWLVLDMEKINQTNFLEPVCEPKKCPAKLQFYWPASKSCVSFNEAKNLCPKGNELKDDVYGEGVCACKKSTSSVFLPVSTTVEPSECARLYDREPCPERQIMLAHSVEGHGYIAQCQADPCAGLQTPGVGRTLAEDRDTGKCHILDSLGPCNQTKRELFQVSKLSYLPECIGPLIGLNIFQGPKLCSSYPDGTCKTPVVLAAENMEFTFRTMDRAKGLKRKRKIVSTDKSG